MFVAAVFADEYHWRKGIGQPINGGVS